MLKNTQIDIKIKLAALWASTMFCYIYCDYFELYTPEKLQSMLDGQMLGPVTQVKLLIASVIMAAPSVMIFLSLILPPTVNRWSNIALGIIFTVMMILVIPGTWHFYKFFGSLEILLTLTIVWHAWRWPRESVEPETTQMVREAK